MITTTCRQNITAAASVTLIPSRWKNLLTMALTFCVFAGASAYAQLTWDYHAITDVPLAADTVSGAATFTLSFTPPVGTNFTVVKNTGSGFISGKFDNLAQGQAVTLRFRGASYNFVANYYGGSGNDLVLQWANVRPLAWGYNIYGELGNNSTANQLTPAAVDTTGVLAGKTITALAGGYQHTVAVCADGTLATWGYNNVGQLGIKSTKMSLVPVVVDTTGALAGKTVIAVTAGSYHNLVLCSDGTMASWGFNAYGQLGNNIAQRSLVPVAVSTTGVLVGKTVIKIASGADHNLAICSDGTLVAWGRNDKGQLGIKSGSGSLAPSAVDQTGVLAGKTVIAIAAGFQHSLALCSDGTLAAWGTNSKGQLGNNSSAQSNVPVLVDTGVLVGKTVVAVAAGVEHSLALCSDGTLAAWGRNDQGQLGNNTKTQSNVPVAVIKSGGLAGRKIIAIDAGYNQSMALCGSGLLAAWGYNAFGELGNNSIVSSSVPVTVNTSALATRERFITTGGGSAALHSLALTAAP